MPPKDEFMPEAHPDRIVFACSCEDTMALDPKALGCAGGELRLANQLCRAGLGAVRAALAEGRPITIGCTQEAPVFTELADEAGREIQFANVREQAGWSDAKGTGPKMAALLAAAAVEMPPSPLVSLASEGVALIYGRDEAAIAVAKRLADTLDVTVLLTRPGAVTPPARDDFPVLAGTIRTATGYLGAFELVVDGNATASPSSRDKLVWGPTRDGAVSRCDIVIDLTGGTPLFPAHDLRDGYLRADPARPETVEKLILDASHLVGTFDKPAYVQFNAGLCAHSRSKRTGCTRCLDVCPTGAITPAGDVVSISAEICAGCGACASVCPTGAATYALPPAEAVIGRLRVMLSTYASSGGLAPVLLLHDEEHGQALIDAAARFGKGLPAHVLPLRLNEVTQADIALVASAYAYGAAGVVALVRARPRHDIASLHRLVGLAATILAPLGLEPPFVLETDDPDALWAIAPGPVVASPSRFLPMATGRHLAVTALKELHRAAGQPQISTPLPAGSPFGAVMVDTAGCTLCLACVAACPVGALRDDPDRPTLRFAEDACVQCGLCKSTCPEKVISLAPRLDLQAWTEGAVTIKQEEPYPCISCGKPFGARSSVERIVAKLSEKHWMFSGANAKRIDVVRMCEDCRVEAVMNESFDPHQSPPRPLPRTDLS
jgi:ferredoxin